MIDHYNAFISYRHSDQDIKVAKAIQSDLEHFHIPRKIRKVTGQKRINRIFLDKDELGAASDLSAEISYALEHADNLIVICSTATKESAWVPREIEYFLRNHNRSQITTVLVNGEPEDVIPDILKYEDRTYRNEFGQEYTVRVPLEPLSCDYRLPRKKARKQELPRLASKLLHCSYDELMNRRRAYRIRQLSIIFSVILAALVGFGAYLLYSRNRIQSNLEASLRNQSLYLANESMYAAKTEQRILALQLALEALPKDEEDPRPVTPQAIRALTDATLSYTTDSGGNDIQTVWNYRMPDWFGKGQCIVSDSGKELLAWDKNHDLKVWSTTTHEELFSLHDPSEIHNAMFLPDSRILIFFDKRIAAYRLSDQTLLWELKDGEYFYGYFCAEITSDDAVLLRAYNLSEERIHRISLSDGTVQKSYELPTKKDDISITYSDFLLSPDEKTLLIKHYTDFPEQAIMLLDLGSGTYREFQTQLYIRDMVWGNDAHVLLAMYDSKTTSSGRAGYSTLLKTDHITIQCIGTATLTERWSYDFTSTNVADQSGFLVLPKNEAVTYYHGNKAEIFRVSDGGKLASYDVNDPIIMAQDPDGDGWPMYATSTGSLAMPQTTDSIRVTTWFANDLSDICFRNGIGFIAHPSGTPDILQYGVHIRDNDFQELDRGLDIKYVQRYYLDDRVLAVLSEDRAEDGSLQADDKKRVSIADPNTGTLMYQIFLEDEKTFYSFQTEIYGTVGNHFYVGYMQPGDGYRILDVDLSSGDTKTIPLAKGEYVSQYFCTLQGSKLYYCCNEGSEQIALHTYDLTTGETASYKILDDLRYANVKMSPVPIPLLNAVLLSINDQHLLVYLDGSPTKTLEMPEDWESSSVAVDVVNQRFAFTEKDRIFITDPEGTNPVAITCSAQPVGLTFYDTGKKGEVPVLLAALTNGTLYRFNANTGELLGKTELSETLSFMNPATFIFDRGSNLLYVKNGDRMSVLDTETWYEELYLSRCLGYHQPSDRFYSYSVPEASTITLGYFKHYSMEDLIQKAKDILQGAELPDEVKMEYGIEIKSEEP